MDPIKRLSSGSQPDTLSNRASWLLYSTEWSDDEDEGEDTNDINEDACSVFSEASLHKEVNRVLVKSSSSESLESWEDENVPWTKLTQENESWDTMVDSQGIILSQDGLTVLKSTLKQPETVPVVPKMYSQIEEDVSSEDTESEWGFLGSSQASTPRNEYSFFTEVTESTDKAADDSRGTTTVNDLSIDNVVDVSSESNSPVVEELSKQVSALIMEQKSLQRSFNDSKQKLLQLVACQSRKIKNLEKKRCEDRKNYISLLRDTQQRNQYLEGLMVDLARECAGLADQVVGVKQEVRQQHQVEQSMSSAVAGGRDGRSKSLSTISPEEEKRAPLAKRLSSSIISQQRVGKLKKKTTSVYLCVEMIRFFGNEPPLLELLLKRLGYEQYLSKFQREKITILELPHITEEQLIQMGIPLGPRQRILNEIQKL